MCVELRKKKKIVAGRMHCRFKLQKCPNELVAGGRTVVDRTKEGIPETVDSTESKVNIF